MYSLGFSAGRGAENTVGDVHFGSPAWKARLGFGQKLIAVNGRDYSGDLLYDATVEAQHSHRPITLLVDFGGPRYPHLVRVKSMPDHLTEVVKPLRKE